ncbi:hypothetical protein [Listeria costaricensis]|uniref:hypothetical protein n=1 Tax=Listeria costaricensis TaxID=2026604 RepID=UPI000C083C47|nr:hypothetical protein [Listeria costaricensis]
MKKMTAAEKNKIMKDWLSNFSGYEKYKPLHLIKRNGPILTGIYLQPVMRGEMYCPIFHTHSLLVPSDGVLSLCCASSLLNKKGAREAISPLRHEAQLNEIIEAFVIQEPLSTKREIDFYNLNEFYLAFIRKTKQPFMDAMYGMVLTAYYFNKLDLFEKNILFCKNIISSWPADVQASVGGDEWEHKIRTMADHEKLKKTFENELYSLGLEKMYDFCIY